MTAGYPYRHAGERCDPNASSDVAHAGLVLLSTPADQCTWSPVAGTCAQTCRAYTWHFGEVVETDGAGFGYRLTFDWCETIRETKT